LKADPGPDEERLLIEAAQHDPRRFEALYARNFERVYAYIARRVPTREEAEDLTSLVFQQALANLAAFEWRGQPFAAWLTRIAANAIADRWHAMRREAVIGADAPEPCVEEDIERQALLFQLVNSLPADQHRVVTGRFVERKSIAEIAREMNRSEGAVKQLQLRALKSLRALAGRADE